jgi:hypothetical protein
MNNYEIREIISRKLKDIKCYSKISHDVAAGIPENHIHKMMRSEIARQIADQLYVKDKWRRHMEPTGEVYSVNGYWLTYDDLYILMEEAFSAGVRRVPMFPCQVDSIQPFVE